MLYFYSVFLIYVIKYIGKLTTWSKNEHNTYHLTECKQKRLFAYTAVFDKRARIASNGLSYGFGHFFEEMSLNRMHAETQYVTINN